MKITQIDYAILGLLSKDELSGYQIRMIFEKTALGNFSSSPGTIYPALARLQMHRLITKKVGSDKPGGHFAISKMGTNAVREWIIRPVTRKDITKGLETLVLRVAFLDSADDRKKRSVFLASMSKALEEYIPELELYYKKEYASMPLGGRLSFEYGLDSYKVTLKWIQRVQRAYASK